MLSATLLKIPVSDLQRAVNFYENALGLAPQFVAEEYGWAQMEGASIAIALYVPGKGGGDASPGGDRDFHLSHPQLDDLLAKVQKATPEAQIVTNNDQSRSLDLKDPDGNIIRIMEHASA